jgi:uncharacterized protein
MLYGWISPDWGKPWIARLLSGTARIQRTSEVVFLLQEDRLPCDPILEALERGKVLVQFSAEEHWPDLRHLLRKYSNLPMSLADACLVRMAELSPHRQVFTADRHFRIYRRHGRQVIPLVAPF